MVGLVLGLTGLVSATTYDLNADFNYNANPNGVWTFGYYQGAGVVPYDIPDPNMAEVTGVNGIRSFKEGVWAPNDYYGWVAKNTNSTDVVVNEWPNQMKWYAGKTHLMTPVSVVWNEWACTVARFTAPSDGQYDINIDFLKASLADVAVDAHVYVNGANVLAQRISNADVDASYDALGVNLTAGQTVDLLVIPVEGSGISNGGFIITQVDATITSVPEPATLVLLSLGGLLLRRKK